MTMPKTAVYKYRYSFLQKHKVRVTNYIVVPTPTDDMIGFEIRYHF